VEILIYGTTKVNHDLFWVHHKSCRWINLHRLARYPRALCDGDWRSPVASCLPAKLV